MLKKCITVVSVMLALVLSLIIICEISDAQAMGGGTITAAQTEKTQDTSPQETTIQAIPLSNPESDPASETGVWKPAGEETTAPEENTSDATVPVPEPTTVPVPVPEPETEPTQETTSEGTDPAAPSDESEPTEETTSPTETLEELEDVAPTEPVFFSDEVSYSSEIVDEEADTIPEKYGRYVPHFYQNDYPDVRYGNNTLARSGCSMTTLAMIADYFTGYDYSPVDLAKWFGWYGKNEVERLEYAATQLKLPWHEVENIQIALDEVSKGKLAIILVNAASRYTTSQHFILVTGVNPTTGKYTIYDSNLTNYSKWDLEDGYENGVTLGKLAVGFDGAWVFDPYQMTENPFRYTDPLDYTVQRYPDITLSEEDKLLLAKLVWLEARGEDMDGQQAVAEVVLNRVKSPYFPNTVSEVILAENQFPSKFLTTATPVQAQYDAIDRARNCASVLDGNYQIVYYAQWETNDNVLKKIGGHYFMGWSTEEQRLHAQAEKESEQTEFDFSASDPAIDAAMPEETDPINPDEDISMGHIEEWPTMPNHN